MANAAGYDNTSIAVSIGGFTLDIFDGIQSFDAKLNYTELQREVLGKQGSHLDQKFKDCTGSISAVKTSENTDAFDALILAAALSSAEKVGTVVRAVRHPKTGRVTTTTWTACIFDKSDSVSVGQESMMSISFKTGTEPVISTT